jgi:hypothetical protein
VLLFFGRQFLLFDFEDKAEFLQRFDMPLAQTLAARERLNVLCVLAQNVDMRCAVMRFLFNQNFIFHLFFPP